MMIIPFLSFSIISSIVQGVFFISILIILSFLGIGSADHYIRTHPELSEAHLAELSEQLLLLCSWRNSATLSIITRNERKSVGFLPSSPPVLRFLVAFTLAYRLVSDRESIYSSLLNIVLYALWRYKENNGPLSEYIHLVTIDGQVFKVKSVTEVVDISSQVLLVISFIELVVVLLFLKSLLEDWLHGRSQSMEETLSTSLSSSSSSSSISATASMALNSLADNVASSIVNATRSGAALDEKGLSVSNHRKERGDEGQGHRQTKSERFDEFAESQAAKLVHANIITSNLYPPPSLLSSSSSSSSSTSNAHHHQNMHGQSIERAPHDNTSKSSQINNSGAAMASSATLTSSNSRYYPINSHVVDVQQQLSLLSLGRLSDQPARINISSLDPSIDEIRLQASRERRAALNERRRTILSTVMES
jgi:hypothetical protein